MNEKTVLFTFQENVPVSAPDLGGPQPIQMQAAHPFLRNSFGFQTYPFLRWNMWGDSPIRLRKVPTTRAQDHV